jgi:L-ascorbate metabolism protein UlaG (beta-lactamase superfamily)
MKSPFSPTCVEISIVAGSLTFPSESDKFPRSLTRDRAEQSGRLLLLLTSVFGIIKPVTISWYGQSCFKVEGKGISLLIDPFSKDIGLRAPRLNADVFLVTHEHYDHNNLKDAPDNAFVIRGPGEYEKSGVYVEGITSFHDNVQGVQRGLNTIYIVRMEDMTLCHMGDFGQTKLTDEQLEAIGDPDILFIPVGGEETINGSEAAAVVREIEPKIIIPMHYKIPGLTLNVEPPQKFLKEMGIKPEEVETYRIAAKNLPTEEMKLIVFKI